VSVKNDWKGFCYSVVFIDLSNDIVLKMRHLKSKFANDDYIMLLTEKTFDLINNNCQRCSRNNFNARDHLD